VLKKLLLCALALPLMGQTVTTDYPGLGEVYPGVVESFGSAGNPYDTARNLYKYNDLTDLGKDSLGGADLIEVNTEFVSGAGPNGYSAYMLASSSQYAYMPDNASNSLGSGVSWAYACWINESAGLGSDSGFGGKGGNLTQSGEWDLYTDSTNGYVSVRMHDGSSLKNDQFPYTRTLNETFLVAGRYNATTNQLEAGVNGAFSGSPTTTASDGANDADDSYVGVGLDLMTGGIGPCLWYRSASGGQLLTDAVFASLYNGGKGKTCSELTATESTGLVSCWTLAENGGPYSDSVGTNDLTAVNAPAQTVGLVSQPKSDMGLVIIRDGSSYLTGPFTLPTESFTFVMWEFLGTGVNSALFSVSTAQGAGTSVFYPYFWTITTPRLQVAIQDSVSGSSVAVCLGLSNNNGWKMLSGGYDATTKKAWCWINPNDTAIEGSALTNGASTAGAYLNVGKNGGLFGSVQDHLAFWPRRLTVPELTELWNNGDGKFE
jgi:hypothetical protein